MGESELECLNLFICRPSPAALSKIGRSYAEKLPVMIWIHGGGFGFGSGSDPMWSHYLPFMSSSCDSGLKKVCIHVGKTYVRLC